MDFDENCYNYVFERVLSEKKSKLVINTGAPLEIRLSNIIL